MFYKINNLVFEGGGVLGIAYLGVLDFLYQHGILQSVKRVAGTSAGAITACITSFNLPFNEIKKIADSLNYKNIPQKQTNPLLDILPSQIKNEFERLFGDLDCVYRLVNNYGWYSSQYFYDWIKLQIANQFDPTKKLPPYTFEDFRNPHLHKNGKPFMDLYIIGTDISCKASRIFSYETTPNMEVAEAVRISMSIPLFFEAVKVTDTEATNNSIENVFSDGGVMRNYPINIFDSIAFKDQMVYGVNAQTLGARFKYTLHCNQINNFLEYISNLLASFSNVQQDIYNNSPKDIARSIDINIQGISPVDFNILPNDEKYDYLYHQGYYAAKKYFEDKTYSRLLF